MRLMGRCGGSREACGMKGYELARMVGGAVRPAVWSAVWDARSAVWSAVRPAVRSAVWSAVWDARSAVWSAVRPAVQRAAKEQRAGL